MTKYTRPIGARSINITETKLSVAILQIIVTFVRYRKEARVDEGLDFFVAGEGLDNLTHCSIISYISLL